jgi:hypothetical protein
MEFDKPTWRNITFDQPYNRQAEGRRMSWDNWRDVLLKTERKKDWF